MSWRRVALSLTTALLLYATASCRVFQRKQANVMLPAPPQPSPQAMPSVTLPPPPELPPQPAPSPTIAQGQEPSAPSPPKPSPTQPAPSQQAPARREPPPPSYQLQPILTAEQRRQLYMQIDAGLSRAEQALRSLGAHNLNSQQLGRAEEIRNFIQKAKAIRKNDPQTAAQLAQRADLLAQDLLRGVR